MRNTVTGGPSRVIVASMLGGLLTCHVKGILGVCWDRFPELRENVRNASDIHNKDADWIN